MTIGALTALRLEFFFVKKKKKRDYTELAVAKKNIDTILGRDHEQQQDFIEKDDPEHSM